MSVTPLRAQVSNSLAFMRRDAVAMSGVPAPTPEQKRSMPPPVPIDSTRGFFMPGLVATNRSAATLAKGNTVDEPTAET